MRTALIHRGGSKQVVAIGLGLVLGLVACGSEPDATTSDAAPTSAATPTDTAADAADDGEITNLTENPDDYDRLVSLAEAEGEVIWYTSLASNEADAVADMFNEAFGIDVVVQRSGGEDTLQRFLLEADSGRVQNDVLSIGDTAAIAQLMQDDYLECFVPRFTDELHEWALDQVDGCWTASRGSIFVIGYRTDLIDETGIDPPNNWADLTQPELNGRVAIGNPNFSSGLKQATALLAEQMGWEWFEDVRDNGAFVVRGNAQLFDAIETGEAIAMGPAAHTRLAQAIAEGLPMGMGLPEEGIILGPSPNAIPVGAPHPNAAKLFLDFLLTDEVLDMLVSTGSYVGRTGFPPAPGMPDLATLDILDVDYDWINENADDHAETFTELFDAERAG